MNILGIVASSGIKNTGPAPDTCPITLTSEDAATEFYVPIGEFQTISGKTATVVASEEVPVAYVGTAPLASATTVDWEGTRIIQGIGTGDAYLPYILLIRSSDKKAVGVRKQGNGQIRPMYVNFSHEDGLIEVLGMGYDTGILFNEQEISFSVNGTTGAVEIYAGATLIVDSTTPASFGDFAPLVDFALGEDVVLGSFVIFSALGQTFTFTVNSASTEIAPTVPYYPAFDWCGNEIEAPQSCTVALTEDIAALIPNGEAMTISGQTASYTLNGTPTFWAASTNPDDFYVKPTGSEIPITELAISATGYAQPIAALSSVDLVANVAVQRIGGGYLASINDGSGIVAMYVVSQSNVMALGVDSSGTPILYVNGTPVEWLDPLEGNPTVPPAIFASVGYILLAAQLPDVHTEGSGSITFRTAGDDFTQTYPAGTLDWCKNALPEQPVELYSYPLNASEALISTLTSTSGNYEKLTPSDDEQTGSVILDVGLTTNDKALLGNLSAEAPAPEFVFLNDMSIGQGAFGFEVHVTFPKTNAPLASPLGFAGVQLRDSVNPNKFFQIGGFTGSSGLPVSGETSVNSVVLYDDGGVKRFSIWGNGVAIISGANLADFPTTVGLDLSALFVFMYIQAGVNPADANKFVDENPTISCRFVTNPAEMVYGPSVFPAGTKTIVGNGIIVPIVPLPTMVAGYRSWMDGEELIELSGYVDGLFGSFYGNPLDGFSALYAGSRDGISLGGAAEFRGDVSAALAGKSLYLDGVEYPITEVSLSSLGNTAAGIPTLPAFVEGVTYTVEFR